MVLVSAAAGGGYVGRCFRGSNMKKLILSGLGVKVCIISSFWGTSQPGTGSI